MDGTCRVGPGVDIVFELVCDQNDDVEVGPKISKIINNIRLFKEAKSLHGQLQTVASKEFFQISELCKPNWEID